jgi:hypothetical protein
MQGAHTYTHRHTHTHRHGQQYKKRKKLPQTTHNQKREWWLFDVSKIFQSFLSLPGMIRMTRFSNNSGKLAHLPTDLLDWQCFVWENFSVGLFNERLAQQLQKLQYQPIWMESIPTGRDDLATSNENRKKVRNNTTKIQFDLVTGLLHQQERNQKWRKKQLDSPVFITILWFFHW